MLDTAKPLLRAWSGTILLLSVVDVWDRPFGGATRVRNGVLISELPASFAQVNL